MTESCEKLHVVRKEAKQNQKKNCGTGRKEGEGDDVTEQKRIMGIHWVFFRLV